MFLNYTTEQIIDAVKTALELNELPESLIQEVDTLVDEATSSSYDDGHSDGYSEGEAWGEESGRDEGWQDGYDEGYETARAEFEDAA
ncbi:hypothetical protein BI024_gp63 [Streptomyces phage Nanodon]|uniref:Flagellar assembly protein H n=1 Tax=Streptomyces phage Nanodon TaxID=1873777 RepID=A0A1B1PA80_9CAUD|nr:hypothetical protein BI024_gp63 [Streptomyces phage Nanodon]ANT41067.1 hypothetical protein SEA_NANODON_63 [Streptomyces phage Nanodon]